VVDDHEATQANSKNMDNKVKFESYADRMLANFSGWSGTKCETCEREMTNAQYAYSIRVFKKPLCGRCQGLEKYSVEG
jgi:hypothetical protein